MTAPSDTNVAARAMLNAGRPPLIALVSIVKGWIEERHLDLLAEAGFDDVRRAHNAVFVHLRSGGMRLTELARAADMSKQAMAELVDDLVEKGYVVKRPDPTDGRAKLIDWGERGLESHRATMEAFAAIDAELADVVGEGEMDRLRSILLTLAERIFDG